MSYNAGYLRYIDDDLKCIKIEISMFRRDYIAKMDELISVLQKEKNQDNGV